MPILSLECRNEENVWEGIMESLANKRKYFDMHFTQNFFFKKIFELLVSYVAEV